MLEGVGVARAGALGILAGAAARAPLAQQVPVAVELDLDLLQPRVPGGVEPPFLPAAIEELVLLLDEGLDPAR